MSAGTRHVGLDGLRAFAAASVLVTHLYYHGGVTDMGPLTPLGVSGQSGVAIFFALSGYLLYQPFASGQVSLREYFLKRAARILPAYLLAVLALGLLTARSDDLGTMLTFSQLYRDDQPGNIGIVWTLRVEIGFYLSLPLLAFVMGRTVRRQLIALAAIATGSFVALAFIAPAFPLWAFVPGPIWVFAPGMVVAIVAAHRPNLLPRGSVAVLVALALYAAGLVVHAGPVFDVFTLASAAIAVGLVLRYRPRLPAVVPFLAAISYAVYLWHLDLIRLLHGAGLGGVALVVATVATVVGVATLSWFFVERPVLRAVPWLLAVKPRRPDLGSIGRLPSQPVRLIAVFSERDRPQH